MSQGKIQNNLNVSIISTQNKDTNELDKTKHDFTTQEIQASNKLLAEIQGNQENSILSKVKAVENSDINVAPISVHNAINAMNQPDSIEIKLIKSEMKKSSIEGLRALDQAYAKSDMQETAKLDKNVSKIIAKTLVPKSKLEKLADRINEEIVSKFDKNKMGSNEKLFAKIVYDKFQKLEESLTIDNPEQKSFKQERALANIEGLRILLQDSSFPASKGLLKQFDDLANSVNKSIHSDMLAHNKSQREAQSLIDKITEASTSKELKFVQDTFKKFVKNLEKYEMSPNERLLCNSLANLISNKESRLAHLDEVSKQLAKLEKEEDIIAVDKFNIRFQDRQKDFVGLAGQCVIDQKESDLQKGIESLKDKFDVLKTVKELRQKLSSDTKEQFENLLQKIHYNSDVCNGLNTLQNDELSNLISKLSQLKNTPLLESYKIAIANMPTLISANELSSIIDNAINIQNTPNKENYNQAFNTINSLFMNHSDRFNPDFALALKSDVLPPNASHKNISNSVDPHAFYSTLMNKQHAALALCNTINGALKANNQHQLEVGKTLNSGALLELLNNPKGLPRDIDKQPIDILVMSACYQLAEVEKLSQEQTFDPQKDFYSLLPTSLKNAVTELLPDISHLSFVSQKQVEQFQTAFTISQKVSALKDFSVMVSELSKNDVKRVQDSIMRLAVSLNIEVKDSQGKKDIQDITKACAERFKETLNNVYEGIHVDVGYIKNMELVKDLNADFITKNPIIQDIAQAQKIQMNEIGKINGGILSGSLVAIQRLLTRTVDDLSPFDLNILRIDKNQLKNPETREFAIKNGVENLLKTDKTREEIEFEANNLTAANWQKSLLLLEYSKLPDNNYKELCNTNAISQNLQDSVAKLQKDDRFIDFNKKINKLEKDKKDLHELDKTIKHLGALGPSEFGFKQAETDIVAQTIDLLKTLRIGHNNIRLNFQTATSYDKNSLGSASGSFDKAGRIFHTLLQSLISSDGAEGVKLSGADKMFLQSEIIINGKSFSRNGFLNNSYLVGYDDKEQIRQALLDILNGEKIQIITENSKSKNKIEEVKYLSPVESAYCVLAVATNNNPTTDGVNPAQSRENRVENIIKDMFLKSSSKDMEENPDNVMTRKALDNTFDKNYVPDKTVNSLVLDSMKNLFEDLAVRVGYNDLLNRMQSQSLSQYQVELSTLFKNPEFKDKLLPLVIMNSFAQSGENSISEFSNNISKHRELVIKCFTDQEVSPTASALLYDLLESNKDRVANVEKTLDYAVGAYAFSSIQSVVADIFTGGLMSTTAKDLRQDSLKMLRQIPESSVLKLSNEKSASIALPSKISPLTAGVSLAKVDGMNLTRDTAGKIHLSISNALFASGKVGANFADLATVKVEGEGGIMQDLHFSFNNDEACAYFMGDFLAGEADMHSLQFCSSVSDYSGKTISGSIEVGVGLEYEEDIFTLELGARAKAKGGTSYSVSNSGNIRTTTTEQSFYLGITTGINLHFENKYLQDLQKRKDLAKQLNTVYEDTLSAIEKRNHNTGENGLYATFEDVRQLKDEIIANGNDIKEYIEDTKNLINNVENKEEEESADPMFNELELLDGRGTNIDIDIDIDHISIQAQASFHIETSNSFKFDTVEKKVIGATANSSSLISGSDPALSACLFAKDLGIAESKIELLHKQIKKENLSSFKMVCTRSLTSRGIQAIENGAKKQEVLNNPSYLSDYAIHLEHTEAKYGDNQTYFGVFSNKNQANMTQRIDIKFAA